MLADIAEQSGIQLSPLLCKVFLLFGNALHVGLAACLGGLMGQMHNPQTGTVITLPSGVANLQSQVRVFVAGGVIVFVKAVNCFKQCLGHEEAAGCQIAQVIAVQSGGGMLR